MSYTIRRWISSGGMLFDDSAKAKTADEAVLKARKLAGIFRGLVTEEVEKSVCNLEPGEVLSIRRPSLKFSMRIRRNKS